MYTLKATVAAAIAFFVFVNGVVSESTLTVRPEDTVTVLGSSDPVVLKCRSSFGAMNWLRVDAGIVLIAKNCTVTDRYTALYSTRSNVTEEDFHQCDLVVNVDSSLAGQYRCSDTAYTADAALVVLDSSPVGRQFPPDVFAGDRLYLECSLNYTGTIKPSVQWIAPDGYDVTVVHNNVTSTSLNSSGFIVVPGGVKKVIGSATCLVLFSAVHGQHRWTSGSVNVQYCPTDVTIYLPKSHDYITTGTVLSCSSHSLPANVTYSWYIDTSSSVLSTGPQFTVLEPGNYSLTCVATNYITSADGLVRPCSANITVNINDVRTTTTTTTTTAATTTVTATEIAERFTSSVTDKGVTTVHASTHSLIVAVVVLIAKLAPSSFIV